MANIKIILENLEKFSGVEDFSVWKKKFQLLTEMQKISEPAALIPFLLTDSALRIFMELPDDRQS